jgi:hypothetical protein
MTPAYATLFNPSAAAGLAIARLRETANLLTAEGIRGKDPSFEEWVTIVDIDRVLPETPSPGRLAPLLRAAGRVATCAAVLIDASSDSLKTGNQQSLETAAAFARASCVLTQTLASRQLNLPSDFANLFSGLDAQRWSRWLRSVHADISLSLREHLAELMVADWTEDSQMRSIRADSDGSAVIAMLSNDPMLHSSSWDVESLAERLAAGIEVSL